MVDAIQTKLVKAIERKETTSYLGTGRTSSQFVPARAASCLWRWSRARGADNETPPRKPAACRNLAQGS